MGYTHHYKVKEWCSGDWEKSAWPKLVDDARLIIAAADVAVCGRDDLMEPIVDVVNGIRFNGLGALGHEPFILSPKSHKRFCKTGAKPYDVVVSCICLRAYALAPTCFLSRSDGSDWNSSEWERARRLYRRLWPKEAILCPWDEHAVANDTDSTISPPASARSKQERMVIKQLQTLQSTGLSSIQDRTAATIQHVEFAPIQQWLAMCEDHIEHQDCNLVSSSLKSLTGCEFRVIDVRNRCVTIPTGDFSFVALSYVWGNVVQPKLLRSTEALLMKIGGLDLAWSILPSTVRDAIVACDRAGERYLWIDALCMIQDNMRDLQLQILQMRSIYSLAKVVLVAASTDSAEAGLLGSLPTGMAKPTSVDSLHALLDSCPWGRRAWCYQEKVLSRRLIFFTSVGIYMQCQKSIYDAKGTKLWDDECQSVDKYNIGGGMLSIPLGQDLESFVCAVEYFSRRSITNAEDKLNAFQGILSRYGSNMDGKSSSFFYGLPICAFDQTFCWRTRLHNPQLRNSAFPSWSWLGWNDAVSFDRNMFKEVRTCQMIYAKMNARISDEQHDSMRKLRNPAKFGPYRRVDEEDDSFGFPSAGIPMFFHEPEQYYDASVATLKISSDAEEVDDMNGLYAVYPTRCSQHQPPARKTISLLELFNQPLPKLQVMDEETKSAPSLPGASTLDKADPTAHESHEHCEAQEPIVRIWLNRGWREQRPDKLAMEFMALAGEKDSQRPGKWTITMLMLLQRMEKNGHFWARERVQVADCSINQERWQSVGGEVTNFKLT